MRMWPHFLTSTASMLSPTETACKRLFVGYLRGNAKR